MQPPMPFPFAGLLKDPEYLNALGEHHDLQEAIQSWLPMTKRVKCKINQSCLKLTSVTHWYYNK